MTVAPATAPPHWLASIRLDPSEPFLRDHQPGGNPLLGTVGGLETIGRVACAFDPGAIIRTIEDIKLPGPIHFREEVPVEVLVAGTPTGGDSLSSIWQLSSERYKGAGLHVTCTLTLAADFGEEVHWIEPPDEPENAVLADMIYCAFFHGPAFRVVGSAWRLADGFAARFAASLPNWSTDGRLPVTSPRLIEFALQTAGLFQLERDGAMRIPRAITRISRWTERDSFGGGPLFAIAQRRAHSAEQSYDISVCAAAGNVMVRIDGYTCVPLPFKTESAEIDSIASAPTHGKQGRLEARQRLDTPSSTSQRQGHSDDQDDDPGAAPSRPVARCVS